MKFEIPLKVDSRLGMNKVYAGKHWSVRKKEADEVHLLVKSIISKTKGIKPFSKPVQITFRYNSRLDCSNHGYLNKLIEDALKGYILVDDSKAYVKRITTEFQSHSKNIIVEVEEFESEEN